MKESDKKKIGEAYLRLHSCNEDESMTNEEAIKIIKQFRDRQGNSSDDIEAFDKAIKALEQQPCKDCISIGVFEQVKWERDVAIEQLEQLGYSLGEKIRTSEDCISREQTLKAFAEKCGGECACCEYNGSGYDTAENCKLIKSMPSVTPSRPRSKWIHWTDDYKDYVTCSCCEYGEEGEVLLSDKTPFCPICGADMRGEDNDNR